MTVGAGRISVPFRTEQGLDTDSGSIRRGLGFAEVVTPRNGLERAIARERANRSGEEPGIGLLSFEAEDDLLNGLTHGRS